MMGGFRVQQGADGEVASDAGMLVAMRQKPEQAYAALGQRRIAVGRHDSCTAYCAKSQVLVSAEDPRSGISGCICTSSAAGR